MEQTNNKRKIIMTASMSILALLLIVGISYAFWQTTRVQEDNNIVASGCFGVELVGNNPINLTNSYPLTNETGMKTTPYTFTITNKCSGSANYIVNLEALSNTTFQNTSVRVALDETNKLYSEYQASEKYYSDSKDARSLISGTLEENGSVTYNLRIWIDEDTPVTEQSKVFASKIVVTTGEGVVGVDINNLNVMSTIDSINITYETNGTMTCKYGTVEGAYENTVSSASSSACNITGLTDNTTYYYQVCATKDQGSNCKDGSIKTQRIVAKNISDVYLGDYIRMTPTSKSYTISKDLTGYGEDQTINPSNLNLWRVIKKNDDGSVDMISNYTTDKDIYFSGKPGYINYIGVLNQIAAQYTDGVHVKGARCFGYNGQTEIITKLSKIESGDAPWEKYTHPREDFEVCDTKEYLCGEDEEIWGW